MIKQNRQKGQVPVLPATGHSHPLEDLRPYLGLVPETGQRITRLKLSVTKPIVQALRDIMVSSSAKTPSEAALAVVLAQLCKDRNLDIASLGYNSKES